jgi:hypothetical protein
MERGFWGAGQGAMTRNGHSIARSCNVAMCRKNHAIRSVARSPNGEGQVLQKAYVDLMLNLKMGGQLLDLG